MAGGRVKTVLAAASLCILAACQNNPPPGPVGGGFVGAEPDTAALFAFVQTEEYDRRMLAVARVGADRLGFWRGCPEMALTRSGTLEILPRPAVSFANGKLVSGNWREAVAVTGCGVQRSVPVETIAQRGEILFGIGLPGSTVTDKRLQADTLDKLLPIVRNLRPACADIMVTDTRFEGPFEEKVPGTRRTTPWRETWSVRICGEDLEVPVEFMPDATGTMIKLQMPPRRPAH